MTGFDLRRLRRGELVAGVGGLLALVFMFVPSWYARAGAPAHFGGRTSWDGWWGLGELRYVLLVTILAALALAYSQAAERGPAIPVTLAVLVTLLGGLSVVAVIYRLVAGAPSDSDLLDQQAGVYLSLLAAIGIAYGGYASMRQEAGSTASLRGIETVRLGGP